MVELEIGDSPFPSTPHAKAAGHPGDRGEPDGLLPEPGPARLPRGGGAVRHGRVRLLGDGPRTSWSPRGPSRSSSTSPRRCSTRATGSWSSARTSRPMFPTSSAAGAGRCWCRSRSRTSSAPAPRTSAHFLATDPKPRADLPQLAAQPDRRRGDPRRPGRDRRRRARHRADGLLRRALLPHGLGGPARVDPGRAGDARAHRGGLHLQQVVQHERLADRLRGGPARRRRGDRQADQHDGLVQPAAGPAGRPGGARARRGDPRRLHGPVPPQGRAALRRACERVDGLPGRPARPARSTSSPTSAPSATGWGSPRTAWRSTCSKGPTTRSASPAWAASASARPAAASSASVAPSPTNASTRPSRSSPRRSPAPTASGAILEANPQFVLREPYAGG